jgi:nicotinate-nucleotide pyrophosphorylase (carboxylating)
MDLTGSELERAKEIVASALAEDIGSGDITTRALFGEKDSCEAAIIFREPGLVCGLPVVRAVFAALDSEVALELRVEEGGRVEAADTTVARLAGPTRAILSGERVALNLLGRLSGIATLTRRFVDAVEGTGVAILDTRKTTPGLRALEKYAVRVGGGSNHRFGLYDGVLVKDNHLLLGGRVGQIVSRLRAAADLPLELEADSLSLAEQALELGVEWVMLDNMSPEEVTRAVELARGRARLEVSGGIRLETVRAYAETGVDAISIGALTHSAASLDVSLEVVEAEGKSS